ncbi:hypothetical protein [Methanoregula sp.]
MNVSEVHVTDRATSPGNVHPAPSRVIMAGYRHIALPQPEM